MDFYFLPVTNPDGYAYTHEKVTLTKVTISKMFNAFDDGIILVCEFCNKISTGATMEEKQRTRLQQHWMYRNWSQQVLWLPLGRRFCWFPNFPLCTRQQDFHLFNLTLKWLNIVVPACSSGNQCSILFRGPTPESELETKAIEKTVKVLSSSLMVFLTVHSYSQLWMTGWSYTEERSDIHDQEVKNISDFHQMFWSDVSIKL